MAAVITMLGLTSAFSVAGCTGTNGDTDAGVEEFVATPLEGGYTGCGSVTCQPGQSCREEGLCYLGCERTRECADGEICDVSPGLGGACTAADFAACGDGICSLGEHAGTCAQDCPGVLCNAELQGQVSCGETTCAPDFYCANPAEGTCYSGCLSITNCPCGQRCNAAPGQPGTCTVPIVPDVPICGDGVCEDPETPRVCLEDCSWEDRCADLCLELDEAGCYEAGQGFRCLNQCVVSDDVQREAFAFCIFLSAGISSCPVGCTDELQALPGFDGGILP